MSLNRIIDLHNRVSAFKNDIGIIIQNVVYENEAYIVDMNTEDQLYQRGVNALGVDISDYKPYSPITIEIKHLKNQPTDRVTLRDTGDFHSSFYIFAGIEQFEINAKDTKTKALIAKYGRQILGLTNENISSLIWDYIFPDLRDQLNKYLLK